MTTEWSSHLARITLTKKRAYWDAFSAAADDDPLRQVTFQPGTAYRVEYGKKRIGKPRQNWIHQAQKCVYVEKLHLFSYNETRAEDNQLLQNAVNRRF